MSALSNPLIRTVPPTAALIPCGVTVLMVTILFVRTAPFGVAPMFTLVLVCVRFTTLVNPAPPGETYATGTCGCMATCGVAPVFMETEEIAQGGTVTVDPMKHFCVGSFGEGFMTGMGLMLTMNPRF